jgi:hypothetical protein
VRTDLPLEFPDGTTPVASHMYIYYGADWSTATPVPIATLVRNIQDSNSPGHHSGRFGEGKVELEKVIAKVKGRFVTSFLVSFFLGHPILVFKVKTITCTKKHLLISN